MILIKKYLNFVGQRMRWSTPEKDVINLSTERHSSEGTFPTVTECGMILEKNKGVLKNRTPGSVKSFIYSELKRKKTAAGH